MVFEKKKKKGSLNFKMTKQPTQVEDTLASSLLETEEVESLFLPSLLLSFKPLYLRLLANLTVNDWALSSRMQLKTNQRHKNFTRSFESIFPFFCLVRQLIWLVKSNMFVMQQFLFISCGTFLIKLLFLVQEVQQVSKITSLIFTISHSFRVKSPKIVELS